MHLFDLAGAAATVLFTASLLPMLAKAARTKDLSSYSVGNLLLANTGNLLYTAYVVSLPPGPVWALHAVHTSSTAAMLAWYLRSRGRDVRRNDRGTLPERLDAEPVAMNSAPGGDR